MNQELEGRNQAYTKSLDDRWSLQIKLNSDLLDGGLKMLNLWEIWGLCRRGSETHFCVCGSFYPPLTGSEYKIVIIIDNISLMNTFTAPNLSQ